MTEAEFNDLMRKSLTNDLIWREMVSTPASATEANEWLTETHLRITSDLGRRRAAWADFSQRSTPGTREYKERLSEYTKWRKSALGFKALVDARRQALRGVTDVSRVHAERAAMREALVRMGKTIEAHQSERLGDAALYGLLDEITLPHGADGEITLRELLNRLMIGASL